jgi:GT2 family glycosyltransferase
MDFGPRALGARSILAWPIDPAMQSRLNELMTRGLASAEFVTANALVRRDALEAVGGFDERFGRAWREDSDLQFRLQALGEVARADAATVLHPVRPERWGVCLRQQRNACFDALLYKKRWPVRRRRRSPPASSP